jgi:hypothetical protein
MASASVLPPRCCCQNLGGSVSACYSCKASTALQQSHGWRLLSTALPGHLLLLTAGLWGGCSAWAASVVSMFQCQVVSTWLVAAAWDVSVFHGGPTHGGGCSACLGCQCCFNVSVPGCQHLAGCCSLGCFSVSRPHSRAGAAALRGLPVLFQCFSTQVVSTQLAVTVRLVCFSVSVPGCQHLAGSSNAAGPFQCFSA